MQLLFAFIVSYRYINIYSVYYKELNYKDVYDHCFLYYMQDIYIYIGKCLLDKLLFLFYVYLYLYINLYSTGKIPLFKQG